MQQALNAFQNNPNVLPVQYNNLVDAITQTPVVLADMNRAAAEGKLKHIDLLDSNVNAAGSYNGTTQTMRLNPLSLHYVGSPQDQEIAKLEVITTLGHEIKHSFNHAERQQERQQFKSEIEALAKSGQPVIDYTAPLHKAQQGDIKDEARAELAAWNAAVRYLQAKQPNQPISPELQAVLSQFQATPGWTPVH